MLNHKPAALIFDMDGTLLDTEPLYTDATQKVLDPYNATYSLALKQQCIGGDSHVSAQIVIDAFNLPLTSEAFLSAREIHLIELFPDAPEMPGASAFIESLAAKGIKLGLATSSHQHLVDVKFSHRSWAKHFSTVTCGDDKELKHGKPAPDIFELCAARLGVAPADCIAFEDSPNGVAAAIAAGMQVIAINSPYVEPGALSDAVRAIDHYAELDDLLASIKA
ncbi:MAG: HAD superfamily hydrolase (TIGR01509 family) [Candidatus Azotimanducaceae bacterium]|jgi:HAD superfamily hydrolase (TIGR01509 family)